MAKKNSGVYGIIMAGGSGERFWPLSRKARPKQCLSIIGQGSMLQQASKRLEAFLPARNIFAMTREGIEKTVAGQLRGLPKANIVAEPCGRDTAGCIALAACLVLREDPEGIMVIVPADHLVKEPKKLTQALEEAVAFVRKEDKLVAFGLTPTEPATGYGYIQAGEAYRAAGTRKFHRVTKYHEKPDLETAGRFLRAGNFWWNSGMFVWKAKSIVEEMHKHLATHGLLCKKLLAARSDSEFWRVLRKEFPKLPKISIDYGVLQATAKLAATPLSLDWDDLGSWTSLVKHLPLDAEKNTLLGNAIVVGGRGNLVRAGDKHLVGVVGTDDLIVVHTQDATLVCPKSKAQELKKLVGALDGNPKNRRFA